MEPSPLEPPTEPRGKRRLVIRTPGLATDAGGKSIAYGKKLKKKMNKDPKFHEHFLNKHMWRRFTPFAKLEPKRRTDCAREELPHRNIVSLETFRQHLYNNEIRDNWELNAEESMEYSIGELDDELECPYCKLIIRPEVDQEEVATGSMLKYYFCCPCVVWDLWDCADKYDLFKTFICPECKGRLARFEKDPEYRNFYCFYNNRNNPNLKLGNSTPPNLDFYYVTSLDDVDLTRSESEMDLDDDDDEGDVGEDDDSSDDNDNADNSSSDSSDSSTSSSSDSSSLVSSDFSISFDPFKPDVVQGYNKSSSDQDSET